MIEFKFIDEDKVYYIYYPTDQIERVEQADDGNFVVYLQNCTSFVSVAKPVSV